MISFEALITPPPPPLEGKKQNRVQFTWSFFIITYRTLSCSYGTHTHIHTHTHVGSGVVSVKQSWFCVS